MDLAMISILPYVLNASQAVALTSTYASPVLSNRLQFAPNSRNLTIMSENLIFGSSNNLKLMYRDGVGLGVLRVPGYALDVAGTARCDSFLSGGVAIDAPTGSLSSLTLKSTANDVTMAASNGTVLLSTSNVERFGIDMSGLATFKNSVTIENSSNIGTNGLNVTGNMVATGDVAGVLDSSLQEDLQQLTTAVERVGMLNGYTYLRVDDGQSNPGLRVRHMGLVAQDVQAAAPESVVIADSGKLSVSYGGVIALMVEAFKALTARVVALEATVA
jgi:hypothetical protein